MSVSYEEFTDASGKTDFAAFHRARVAAGEECQHCGRLLFRVVVLGPQSCSQCLDLGNVSERARHDRRVRCPECIHVFEPDRHGLIQAEVNCCYDGHNVECPNCEATFKVDVRVSVEFVSPAAKEPSCASD